MKIETTKITDGSEISCCPERGGIITSIKLRGKEVLYMDEKTFLDTKVNVKGGIPILFPQAGPIPEELVVPAEFQALKQHGYHGFARTSSHWSYERTETGFSEELRNNEETLKLFPFKFKLTVSAYLQANYCIIDQEVFNPHLETKLHISIGLHPYFKVPREAKGDIEFQFPGGETIKAEIDKWANGKAISIVNPSFRGIPSMRVNLPGLGWLILDASRNYERIWVWSLPGKDFICIEPVMRDKGAIITDPVEIEPVQTAWTRFVIRTD